MAKDKSVPVAPSVIPDPGTLLAAIEVPSEALAVGFADAPSNASNYLAFPMSRSRKWHDYRHQFPDLQEYEPLVVLPGLLRDEVTRVCHKPMTMRVWYIHGCECFAELSLDNGAIVRASRNQDDKKLKDHCESVCLVYISTLSAMIPVKVSWRNALAAACRKMEKIRAVCQTPEWIAEGPAYAATAKYPPQFRAFFDVTIFTQVSRSDTANRYPLARVTPLPTSDKDVALLHSTMQDAEFKQELAAVMRSYRFRVDEIMQKIETEPARV